MPAAENLHPEPGEKEAERQRPRGKPLAGGSGLDRGSRRCCDRVPWRQCDPASGSFQLGSLRRWLAGPSSLPKAPPPLPAARAPTARGKKPPAPPRTPSPPESPQPLREAPARRGRGLRRPARQRGLRQCRGSGVRPGSDGAGAGRHRSRPRGSCPARAGRGTGEVTKMASNGLKISGSKDPPHPGKGLQSCSRLAAATGTGGRSWDWGPCPQRRRCRGAGVPPLPPPVPAGA